MFKAQPLYGQSAASLLKRMPNEYHGGHKKRPTSSNSHMQDPHQYATAPVPTREANAQGIEGQLRRLTDSWLGAMLGALVYAAWAVFANWSAGAPAALRIAAVHWVMSTLLTYYGTTIMRIFFGISGNALEGALLAFMCGLAFTYSILIAVHQAIGTPHIALTLAAGVIPTVLFCGGYALLLLRTSRTAGAVTSSARGV